MRIFNRYMTFDRNQQLIQLLNELNIPYNEQEKSFGEGSDYYGLEFFLYEDDISFEDKSNKVRKFNISPQVGTEFSKEDEEKAEWFQMSVGLFGYPQPMDNYFELTYAKDDVCLQCQIGKQQVNPFRFTSEPKAKHSQFLGLNWVFDEFFIREQAIKIFQENSVRGLYYSRPIFKKSKLPLSTLQQMHVATILQPGLLTENLEFEFCTKPTDIDQINFIKENNPSYLDLTFCGQKKYNFPRRGPMKFKRELFENQPDFVKPYEWFGSAGSASRPILVSKKIRQLIIKEKLRGVLFTPIELV